MEDPPSPLRDTWTTPPAGSAAEHPWSVYIDDNFHYMDEHSRVPRGRYATLDEAVAVCMQITQESVSEHAASGMESYTMFGDDPWVSPQPSPEELAGLLTRHPDWPAGAFERGNFSARLYAGILLTTGRAR